MADWGAVPKFIRGSSVRRYIARELQLSLPIKLPAEVIRFSSAPVYRDLRGRKVPAHIWHGQPLTHPLGKANRARAKQVGYQAWRIEYERTWSERRKALGLPHEVTNPFVPKPERKRA